MTVTRLSGAGGGALRRAPAPPPALLDLASDTDWLRGQLASGHLSFEEVQRSVGPERRQRTAPGIEQEPEPATNTGDGTGSKNGAGTGKGTAGRNR